MKNNQLWWVIAKKEFFSYLNSAVAYIIMVPFLVLNAFLFLRAALVMGDANLRPMVELLPWFLMVIGPALSMRAFADERRKDTLELMYAHPVSEWTIVLSKFVGLMMFYGLMLLATLPLPVTLGLFSTLDVGMVVGQYVGAFSVGAVFIAVGMAAAAVIGNAVGSFLAAAAFNFLLIIMGMSFITLMFPGIIGRILTEASIMQHVTSVSRGVIDLRNGLYFGSLLLLAFTFAVMKLSERKVAEYTNEKRRLWMVVGLIVVVTVLGNIVAYEYPLRVDLTSARRYSLSSGTKTLLKNLPDRVTITLYASGNLPGPMQTTLRETSDWLKDFRNYGKKISLKTVVTDANPANRNEALQQGIREVQFNQIGSSSFQVATGFLGMTVRYADKTETIDFIEDSSNLEYQLARTLLKMTQKSHQKVGLLAETGSATTEQLAQFLGQQYDVTTLTQTSSPDQINGLAGLVVVDDGTTQAATEAAIVRQFVTNGGNLAVFADGMSVDTQTLKPVVSKSMIIPVVSEWGVTLKPDLVYDTQLNEPVTLGSGALRYIMPYPFWMRALVKKNTSSFQNPTANVLVGWASSVETRPVDGVTTFPLLASGPRTGGVQTSGFLVNPQESQKLPVPTGEKTVGVLAEKGKQRMAVIGDATMTTDEFLKNSRENQTFVSNLIDWVAADPILSTIRRRETTRTVFTFSSPLQVQLVQYANIGGPALLTAVGGAWWLWRRKKLTRRIWRGGTDAVN